jgi:hypothetical protein
MPSEFIQYLPFSWNGFGHLRRELLMIMFFMGIVLKKGTMMDDGTLELPIGEIIYVLLIYVSMIKGISVEITVLVHRIVIGLLKRDRPSCA